MLEVDSALVLWLISSAIGVMVSVFGLVSAGRDLATVQGLRNGRRLVVVQRVVAQGTRGAVFTLWLAIALLPAAQDHVAGVLILTNVLITVVALSDYAVGVALRHLKGT